MDEVEEQKWKNHQKLIQLVADGLVDDDFKRLRNYSKVWLQHRTGVLEKITTPLELLGLLEREGIIEVGYYTNLIEMLKEHRLLALKKEVEKMAERLDIVDIK